jgi:hypothetical protein
LNFLALWQRQLQLNGLVLRKGNLLWQLSPTNSLALENIQTDLRFGTNDTWSLDHFSAEFSGATLVLAGDVAHAPEIRRWGLFHREKAGTRNALKDELKRISTIKFVGSPGLVLNVNGDARKPESFEIHVAINQGATHLVFDGSGLDPTNNFHGRVHGTVLPQIARPLLTGVAVQVLNHLTFASPAFLDVEVHGRMNDFDSFGATGRVALTNITIRGQSADTIAGDLFYTNRVLDFFAPHLARARGAQIMMADKVTLNFIEQRIYFTNGFSTAEPLVVARAIGPKVGRLLEPYQFLSPPTTRVNGCSPMRDVNGVHDIDDADLRFEVIQPASFQWLKFRTSGIQGTVHWLGETLTLTNVTAPFYGGSGTGFAAFDFGPVHEGADYQFEVNLKNVNLHGLASDITTNKNKLDGSLSGKLVVTHADTRDWNSWEGFGHANLHDGLLWDIRIFGILSPVLNVISPGLGNSRATDASARFTITNGVILTDSLEISTLIARLNYVGTVNFKQKVDARVTAHLLRETPVVGSIISTILWPVGKVFEYKITGTLANPKSEPVYVPKILLMPFHPIRSIEELLPVSDTTNAPVENNQ